MESSRNKKCLFQVVTDAGKHIGKLVSRYNSKPFYKYSSRTFTSRFAMLHLVLRFLLQTGLKKVQTSLQFHVDILQERKATIAKAFACSLV